MWQEHLVRLVSHLGAHRLRRLETLAQVAQGKGWGSGTVAQEVAALRELLGDRVDDAFVVLDVGANIGAWTLQALNSFPRAQIHVFEPGAVAFAELSSTVGSDPRVSLNQLAIGATDGEAVLYANVPGSGLASLSKRRLDHLGIEFSHREPVRVTTLLSWARSAGIDRIDALKLDVEGHEMDVLRGAGTLLDRVGVIQFEFGGCNIDTRTYFQDFWYFLTKSRFEIYRLGPAGLTVMSQYSERDETFRTTNYFARRSV